MRRGLTVVSRGQVYYHRPGNWTEQPNFFNPYWRPRLASVWQGTDQLPYVEGCSTGCRPSLKNMPRRSSPTDDDARSPARSRPPSPRRRAHRVRAGGAAVRHDPDVQHVLHRAAPGEAEAPGGLPLRRLGDDELRAHRLRRRRQSRRRRLRRGDEEDARRGAQSATRTSTRSKTTKPNSWSSPRTVRSRSSMEIARGSDPRRLGRAAGGRWARSAASRSGIGASSASGASTRTARSRSTSRASSRTSS